MERKSSRFLLIATASALLLWSCSEKNTSQLHKSSRLLMGTLLEVTVIGPEDKAKATIEAVFDEFKRVEDLSSFHKPSELTKLNEHAGNGPVKVNPELLALIATGLKVAKATGGAFDPTVGPLCSLWHFSGGDPRLPGESEISEALTKVGWNRVKIDEQAETVLLPESGMALDLGAVAKGYALDRSAQIIRQSGARAGLVNAGGDVVAVGEKEPGKPWRVGVRDPRDHKGIIAVAEITDRAILTSGDYERSFIQNGRRYHHILDPRTGYPVEGVESVTLVAPRATSALSCAVFALGVEKGLDYVASMPGVEALIVDAQAEIHMTQGAGVFFKEWK
jgi:thiamine biosynthesis lipoprotein